MSVPVTVGCIACVLVIGVPVLAGAGQLEARHRAAGAADAAALAAADAVAGWINAEPCAIAGEVAASMDVEVVSCEPENGKRARVVVRVDSAFGSVEARAHAGVADVSDGQVAAVAANGWAWPSGVRGVTQGHHDGQSIDLAVSADGALYAPYDGVVVAAGPLGGGMPPACLVNPTWWRGVNHGVVIRHEYRGLTLYSSHNHIAPGSPEQQGIAVGARVRAGERVATAGMSGCTSGLHTHFTLSTARTNAFSNVDPYLYIGRP
ncbi:Rv3654c family TadE-like protein [Leucobacter sp. GX24907]